MTEDSSLVRIRRRDLLERVGVGALSATGIAATVPAETATAQTAGATVDLAATEHPVRHEASGLLYGLSEDGSAPSDRWLAPIDSGLQVGGGARLASGGWGTAGEDDYERRWNAIARQYERVTGDPHDAQYCIRLSDLWGADATQADADPHPGDDGDWGNYEAFLDRVLDDVEAAGMDHDAIQYEIWNEPNIDIFWPRSRSQFHEMWRRGVEQLRARHPDVRIVGPGHTHYSQRLLSEFLDMTIETDTVPDVVNWHVLQSHNDAVETADAVRDLLAERGLADRELEVNEYVPSDRVTPGYTAWDLARVEKSDVDYAALANWTNCCTTPALCDTLTADGTVPTSRWWVLARYGQTRGDVVRTTAANAVDSAANLNPAATQSRIVVGNHGEASRADLTVRNVDRISDARVRVTVERLPDRDGDALPAPLIAQDYVTDVGDGDHTVSIDWSTATDAYVVTLTPATPAVSPGTYRIRAAHSGHVLGVDPGANGDGAAVRQQADDGVDRQRWSLDHLADGVYRIENVATGKVLDVAGAAIGNGATVHQWTDNGGENQHWRVEETRRDHYRIEAVHSGKLLAVAAGATEAGTAVHQWVDRGEAIQRWQFEPVDAADGPPPMADGTVPGDVDGDGDYEDFTGNDAVDYADLTTFFDEMDGYLAENVRYFDYSGNGEIDYQDLVALFEQIP